ncbi:MAG: metalloregulator ArsR/SmtB family transcription factor [Planctomycetota bacterium]
MAKWENNTASDVADVARALSDESRLRALCALEDRELCVCQIVEFLGLAPSTVSKHMSTLRDAGLVESYKDGRWVHYRLPEGDAPSPACRAREWALESLRGTSTIREDERRLEEILEMDAEELCRKQSSR